MPKVKQQTAGKIGLFSAIMMIFGAVVGIGIFFKNGTVFRLNNYNAVGIILSWVISIIIVLCMALSFAELSSVKMKNRNEGLGGWANQFCGHKFGRFAKIGYTAIFYPVNTFAILFFLGEALLNIFGNFGVEGSGAGSFDFGKGTVAYVFIIGAVFFAGFLLLNLWSSKAMSKFGNIAGLIKFAPIAMVIILGIVFGVLYGQNGIWGNVKYDPAKGIEIANDPVNLMGMISSIPAILFAYEGYLVIGNIGGDMKNPERNVPLAVVLGVAIISALYLAITIGCMTAGTGNIYHLMSLLLQQPEPSQAVQVTAQVLTYLVSIFIFLCLVGTINAMAFSGSRAFQALCEDGTLFKGKQLVNVKPNNPLFAGAIYFSILVAFWWLLTIIPSAIGNTDAIADGSSAVMVVALYLIYGITVLGGFINRFTKKHETRKIKVFPVAAVIAIIASFFVFAYCGFYQFLAKPIADINSGSTIWIYGRQCQIGWDIWYDCGWGMFVRTHAYIDPSVPTSIIKDIEFLSYKEVMLWFWGMFAIMMAMPFINDLFIHLWDKKSDQVLIWQNKRNNVPVLN